MATAELHRLAESVVRMVRPQPRELVEIVVAGVLSRLVESVRQGGWDEHDLVQLVSRNAGDEHVPMLRAVLDGGRRLRLHAEGR